MDKWNRSNLPGVQDRSHKTRRERENPSFSSTLLDQIYRSIDGEDELVLYTETLRKKKQYSTTTSTSKNEQDVANFRRIEKWMEKKKVIGSTADNIILPNKSAGRKSPENNAGDISSMLLNSSWSSSDSSSGGYFSSEAESNFGVSSNSNYRPKPIRTSVSTQQAAGLAAFQNHEKFEHKLKHQGGGGFVKTKSKALKIYGDLKKVKQPISPGGRLASFLNSIFSSAGNAKKAKISSSEEEDERSLERKSKSAHASSCSSASSFSRSCLSKTQCSNGTKRSVRFYPLTTVIVDADYQQQSRGHNYDLQRDERNNNLKIDELKFHIREKNQRVEEAARELLKNYHKKIECQIMDDAHQEEEGDDDDDDAASYASSDLFELDNLNSAIERYREELPVYETTYFDTNRAIANGLIL